MTGEDNHKIFTAADIRRYLNGQMTEAEMFTLESAALEDPFLADAIEGFDQSGRQKNSDPAEDIKELHARLRERITRNERRRLPLFLKKNVAAILILLAGAGTMVYYLVEKTGGDRTYISQKESARPNLQDSVATITVPSADLSTEQIKKNTTPATTEPETLQQSRQRKAGDAQAAVMSRRSEPKAKRSQPAPAEDNGNAFKKDIGYSSVNKPGAVAASTAAKNRALSMQDSIGDTLNFAEKATSDNNNTATSRANKQAPPVSSREAAASGVQPLIGWKAYEIYLQDNKKLPPSSKNIHGKVVLSFTIGQNGKPRNFQVIQSLDKIMDEEAIRLVKDGPLWTANESRVTTTINF